MIPILYIKGSNISDVRLQKFLYFFQSKSFQVSFWGWDRLISEKETNIKNHNVNITYPLRGGGYGGRWLFLYYPLWMFIIFFKVLFSNKISSYNIICINFECGLPVYLASKIRNINYIYEIYDEFSISHRFPLFIRKVLTIIDRKIMESSKFVIHVDENRVSFDRCKYIVIENSPYDYYKGNIRNYDNIRHSFAIIGNISKSRGIDQIYLFAKEYPKIDFLLAGTFYDSQYKDKLLSLSNVRYYDRMPQDKLFYLLTSCCGIFSLYDPVLDINKLAASNKVYDAMMLGIPVITNPDVINSRFVQEQNVGVVLNYQYDESWSILADNSFVAKAKIIGENGRELYLKKYEFGEMVEHRLLSLLL